MSLFAWIVIGVVAGFFASVAVNHGRAGFWAYILVGLGGSVLGGLGASMAGWHGVQMFNWRNVLASLVVSIIALVAFRLAQRKYGWNFPPLADEA